MPPPIKYRWVWVIGDSGLRRQLIDKEMMPWVKFVTTKESLTRYAAKFQPQRKLREDTICAVKEVLASDLKKLPLYETAVPAVLGIDFKSTAMADAVALTPGVRRLSGTEVEITCADMKGTGLRDLRAHKPLRNRQLRVSESLSGCPVPQEDAAGNSP